MKQKKDLFVVIFFLFVTLLTFRSYFLKGLIPFPSNLLVSFYQPWMSYTWKDYPSGAPNKPIGFDNLRIFYPYRFFTIEQAKSGMLPLWNPYSFSGNTHLATYQSAVFHPASFLFFVFSQTDAWSLIVVLQPLLAGVFMYIFLRAINLPRRASLFGSLVFAFSGFMIVWWEENIMSGYSFLVLPLILFSVEKFLKQHKSIYFVLLVLVAAFSILSGWFQATIYVFLLSIAYIFFSQRQLKTWRLTAYIFFAFFISLLVSGIHLIPAIEAFIHSARGNTDIKFVFELYLQPLYHLITFVVPDLFGNPGAYNYFGKGFYFEKVIFIGIPALFFVLYSYATSAYTWQERFFKWAGAITLSLGFSLPTSWLLLYYLKLPFLSVLIPSRIFFLSTFCFSVLAAFALEKFMKNPERKKVYITLGVIGISIVFAALYAVLLKFVWHKPTLFIVSIRNIIIPTFILIALCLILWLRFRFNRLSIVVFLSIVILSTLSSLYFANKYLYFSDKKLVFPSVPVLKKLQEVSGNYRFWSIGKAYVDKNFATQYKLYSPEGYDSLYIRRYGELLYAAKNNGKYSLEISRADADFSNVDNINQVEDNLYRKRLLSLLGVKYMIESKKETEKLSKISAQFAKVWNDDKFTIYKYSGAFPRMFLVWNYIVERNPQKILDKLFDEKIDLSKTAVLEENIGDISGGSKGIVEISSYKPNTVAALVKTEKRALLFFSDNYFPGWKAYIDGKETLIYRTNYSFRSIVVPAGEHKIVFDYKPMTVLLGAASSIIGVLILLLVSWKMNYLANFLQKKK